jgi:hypothetical protein
MQLHLPLGLRLFMGCLAQSLRHPDSPSFAIAIFQKYKHYKPKPRYRTSC